MSNDTDSRIDELESRFAFQEEAIRELGDALVAQQGRIDTLEATIRQVVDQLRRGAPDEPPEDQPPPHY